MNNSLRDMIKNKKKDLRCGDSGINQTLRKKSVSIDGNDRLCDCVFGKILRKPMTVAQHLL